MIAELAVLLAASHAQTFDEFHALRLETECKVTVRYGNRCTVQFGPLSDRVSVRVEDGVLVARSLAGTEHGFEMIVTTPRLDSIEIGAAAEVELDRVRAGKLMLLVNGAAEISGRGVAESLAVTINGAAELNLAKFVAPRVDVTVNGAAELDVFARERLAVEINGAAQVRYHSVPEDISKSVTGAGTIESAL